MVSFLRRFFAPPIFQDENDNRGAKLLLALAWLGIPFTVITFLLLWARDQLDYLSTVWFGWQIGAYIFALILLYARRLRAARLFLLATVWLSIVWQLVVVSNEGVADQVFNFLAVVVILGGLFFGRIGALSTAIISILLGWGMLLAQTNGYMPASLPDRTLLFRWLFASLQFSGVAILIHLATDILNQALHRAQESESNLNQIVAEQQAMTDQLRQEVAERKQAERLAQSANEAKTKFISIASHELRAPLTSIGGYAEILAKGVPEENIQTEFLGYIQANVRRMSQLLSDLMDVSRMETGSMELEKYPIFIEPVLRELLKTTHYHIERKKQRLQVNVEDDLPAIMADPSRLFQIIANLINNASKYSPNQTDIALNVYQQVANYLTISVADNGYGIEPIEQSQIFSRYFRSKKAEIRQAAGTGLGLHITKSLVEMQGGKIWFESQPGQGTTFYFTMPIATPEDLAGEQLPDFFKQ